MLEQQIGPTTTVLVIGEAANKGDASEAANAPLAPEERFRKATSAKDFLLVVAGLLGEGKKPTEIVEAVVDAKIADAQLPEGTDRDAVKKGIRAALDEANRIWFK